MAFSCCFRGDKAVLSRQNSTGREAATAPFLSLGVRLEAAEVANIAEAANIFFWQPRAEGFIDVLLIAWRGGSRGVPLAANRARAARVRGVFVGAAGFFLGGFSCQRDCVQAFSIRCLSIEKCAANFNKKFGLFESPAGGPGGEKVPPFYPLNRCAGLLLNYLVRRLPAPSGISRPDIASPCTCAGHRA